jgi:hypothetical protein
MKVGFDPLNLLKIESYLLPESRQQNMLFGAKPSNIKAFTYLPAVIYPEIYLKAAVNWYEIQALCLCDSVVNIHALSTKPYRTNTSKRLIIRFNWQPATHNRQPSHAVI